MMMVNIKKITKFSTEQERKLLCIFAKMDDEVKIDIFHQQKKLFFKLKKKYKEDSEVIMLASLYIAISKISNFDLKILNLKNKHLKKNVKEEKLLEYWSIVKDLKLNKNLSFREIAMFLQKYYKFKISFSTIFKVWKRIENQKNKEEK